MTVSALRVGRADLINNVNKWDAQGDQVAVSGLIPTTVIADAKAIRQQLLGYLNNPDERVIPITMGADSTVDGFYRVDGATVNLDTPGRLAVGYWPYELALTRMPQYALPLMESWLLGALRTNAATITNTELPWLARSVAWAGSFALNTSSALTGVTRTAADGDLFAQVDLTNDHDWKLQQFIAPANFYLGAATIESGSSLYKVTGRQIAQDPLNWRISNGLIRVTPVISGGFLRLAISCFDGVSWDTAVNFNFVAHGTGELNPSGPVAISILKNAPSEVIIRLTIATGGTIDLLLRRGARMVYGVLTSPAWFGTLKLGIIPTTTAASTTLTGGLRRTASDSGGNRFVIASPNTVTKDLTTGEVYLTANGLQFSFAAGFETPGGTATAYDTAQSLILQYMAADTEQLSVVQR